MVKYSPQALPAWNELKQRARADMAQVYRLIRRENPALARILFKQGKQREKELLKRLYGIS